MPFPEVQRVIFNKNPLQQVICQLRFPAILKIESDLPYIFQDKIRRDFPNYSELIEAKFGQIKNLNDELPNEIIKEISQSTIKNYQFISDDNHWKINLTRSFIALSTDKYYRWEEFNEKFRAPLRAFLEIYGPFFFSRIGLRYVNVFDRSKLGVEKSNWNELFQPYMLGVVGSESVGNQVNDFECRYEISLSDGFGMVRLITKFVKSIENDEICFVIDSDFHEDKKTETEKLTEKLDFFHSRSTRLIQWAITEKLYNVMEPKIVK